MNIHNYPIELARRNLIHFATYIKPDYIVAPFHRAIANKLEDVFTGKTKRLIINMPPRHGKSELVSRLLPAWALGKDPTLRIISTSYGFELSTRMNRDIQRYMLSDGYKDLFPDTRLNAKNVRSDSQSNYLRNSEIFEIVDSTGFYKCAGVGGSITGMGADLILVDDPIKSIRDANSKTVRQSTWDWLVNDLMTRLEPNGSMVICQTRWHHDDIAGRLIKNLGDHWEVFTLPAIDYNDQALWPERFNLETLNSIKKNMGSKNFESLYQQKPTADEGGLIKRDWLSTHSERHHADFEYVMSWDMAFKGNDNSDYVVGQLWGKRGANRYLFDQVRGRWDFVDTIKQFIDFSNRHPYCKKKIVEDKANGPGIISALKDRIEGIVPYNPKDSKEARLNQVAPLFEAGNVFLPEGKDFTDDLIEELVSFPNAAHDDMVDALTQALINLESSAEFAFNVGPELYSFY